MPDPTLDLAKQLIARPSITPRDEGCLDIIAARLAPLGFKNERLRFGDVDNLWTEHGSGAPLFVFAGHTDVVPTGPLDAWHSDPFAATIRDGQLYGRGAADMKSSIAAFVTAVEAFVKAQPKHFGRVALLLTSDEEGPAVDGTVKVVDWLKARGQQIRYCLIGEPTALKTLGDVMKVGRRGSLNGRLIVHGIQGHVAYPQHARNPIHLLAPALAELAATKWDQGNDDFPPTRFQASNINAGTGADNVIPGELRIQFNFRFSTAVTEEKLRQRTEAILQRHGVDFTATWVLSGKPFLTRERTLVDAARKAVRDSLGIDSVLSTDGGTSDGRFIAPTGAEVIELGAMAESIHKIDEHVPAGDPARLADVYRRIIENIFGLRS